METEVLPVVDLCVLSKSDLDALAAASAHAVAPRSCLEADPLPPLKIDRAVFNESVGSRKQTFSRRRLGAAASAFSDTRFGGIDEESELIAYHLRCLFSPDDPSLPPPPQTLALPAPDPDKVTTNSKGVSVDLVGLSRLVDPYEAELRKRTAGLVSESELMGFISSLGGQWASQRMQRKFVDAAFFGNHLPSGWKLQLGLKRKNHIAWVHCFSYVSPKRQQFATCKEVSEYLMSLLGYPELKMGNIEYGSTQQHDLCDDGGVNVVGVQHQIGLSMDSQSFLPNTSDTFSSHFNDSRDNDERNTDATNSYECQQCNLTFHDQSAYAQHHSSFHKVRDKRRKIGNNDKFGEPVVGKDWKFERPVCHKAFEEQSRYYGHVGAHARYQGLIPEALLATIPSGKVGDDSFAELSFNLQELNGPPEQTEKINSGEARFQHHNHSAKHGGNSTRGIELFNSSYSFNGPNQTWCTPEEIAPTTDAPSTHSYRNDMMDHADRTVLKIAPHPNDQLDCRINGFAEATDFNNQAGRHQVFRHTSNGTANHCQHQIIDCAMTTSKHAEVNTMKTRDVNLNSCQDMISFPIATTNNKTSTDLNDNNRSCITGKCFGDSFSNNDGARIAVGAYNSNILTGDITERSFAQFYNNSSHIRPNISSHSSLTGSSTLTASNLIKGSDVNWKSSSVNKSDANCITGSFVNRLTNNNQPIGSMFEVMGRTSNGMQHHYNDCATGCDPLASANTSQNANSLMPRQDNFSSTASVVRSVDLPINSTTRDQQCDLQLGFSDQKQQVFPGYGELRSAADGSPQLRSMARNSSIFTRSSAGVWGHDLN
ncbi:hypothetical protein GUJ93_ZPchr0010g11277 [Zizania palustris]|uniref:C2H2-type domain-containing protein n=1 Tax=Zizania palustris TaxID=103762 RepID=A0A8J5WEU5_ZIZPA|nr:hypothetical protein GUJ93_ZPchr0010g11277 [Zizania palustris]